MIPPLSWIGVDDIMPRYKEVELLRVEHIAFDDLCVLGHAPCQLFGVSQKV